MAEQTCDCFENMAKHLHFEWNSIITSCVWEPLPHVCIIQTYIWLYCLVVWHSLTKQVMLMSMNDRIKLKVNREKVWKGKRAVNLNHKWTASTEQHSQRQHYSGLSVFGGCGIVFVDIFNFKGNCFVMILISECTYYYSLILRPFTPASQILCCMWSCMTSFLGILSFRIEIVTENVIVFCTLVSGDPTHVLDVRAFLYITDKLTLK